MNRPHGTELCELASVSLLPASGGGERRLKVRAALWGLVTAKSAWLYPFALLTIGTVLAQQNAAGRAASMEAGGKNSYRRRRGEALT